jgi:hypothetical protein
MKTYTKKRKEEFNNYIVTKYNFILYNNIGRLIKGDIHIQMLKYSVHWLVMGIAGETDDFKPDEYKNMDELYEDIFNKVIKLYDKAYWREYQIDSILND